MTQPTDMTGRVEPYRYRITEVRTHDYGDGPAAGVVCIAHAAIIPDGSHWQDRPATISFRVQPGTRPGGIIEMSLQQKDDL